MQKPSVVFFNQGVIVFIRPQFVLPTLMLLQKGFLKGFVPFRHIGGFPRLVQQFWNRIFHGSHWQIDCCHDGTNTNTALTHLQYRINDEVERTTSQHPVRMSH
jgi:hypothetical protein